jgi:hypothetical protein
VTDLWWVRLNACPSTIIVLLKIKSMENLSYKRVSGILYVENGTTLKSKTMNIAKIADNAYITRPMDDDKVTFVLELNGVYWIEADVPVKLAYDIIPNVPHFLNRFQNHDFAQCKPSPKAEIIRRAVHPELPVIWELKEKAKQQLPEGMVKVHALRYKQDGNTLTDYPIVLSKIADCVYCESIDDYNDLYFTEINGVIFQLGTYVKCNEDNKSQIISLTLEVRNGFIAAHTVGDNSDCYFNNLEIEVMKRLGYDVTPLLASRKRCLEMRAIKEKQDRAERKAREKAQKEAEEIERKARLEVSRAKIEHGEFLSPADFLELADSVSFKIHPRTRGLLLSSVTEVGLGYCRYRNVPGKRKKTADSFNGVHEAYFKLRCRITH